MIGLNEVRGREGLKGMVELEILRSSEKNCFKFAEHDNIIS